MNMMFENNSIENFPLKSTADQEVIPVSSLEEVAIRFKNDDEEFHYDHYLVQVRRAKRPQPQTQTVAPPPFKKANAPVSVPSQASSQISSQVLTATASPAAVAAKMDKEEISFLTENADLLLQAGEIELARNIYRAILKSGEASEVAYAGLAACADREGLIEQAIQFAQDSVAFAPNQKGYQLLAELLVQQGRDQEAAQTLSRALKSPKVSSVDQAEYYKMIGNCQSRLGQNQEAESAYLKSLELNPSSDEVQSNLGSLYLEQGRISDAKRRYQDSVAANPQNDKAWVGLGLCYVAVGDKESAHEAFAKSLERNLRNSTAIFHLVKCAYEIKKYNTAERMLSDYVEIAPVSPSLLYSLAGLQFHVGKRNEASATAKRILQIRGDHSGAKELIQKIEASSAR
jgi:tetratricopeptide (TPR) repeat protein